MSADGSADLTPPAGLPAFPGLKVALVHDWLTGMRGGEKVLDAICELFPDAPLYTLIHVPGTVSPRIEGRRIVTSFAQALPNPRRFYRHYLPLYPLAVELFNLKPYDLVISSSHCAVKSVKARAGAVHVCYCHSPMRYGWDQFDAYFGPDQVGWLGNRILAPVMGGLARWDAATAGRVDRFLANSQYVAGRIRRYYNRGSTIVYPPVDTDYYSPDGRPSSPSFLIVSALVPYKRLDVAIQACRQVGAHLRIVGTGPEEGRLRAMAGPTVEFLGWQSDARIRDLYRESQATLLPGVEDFGIVPVEAQACGCPVVALNEGGARETVVPGATGVLVDDVTPEAFAKGLERLMAESFDPAVIRDNALRFSRSQFMAAFTTAVQDALQMSAANGPRSVRQADPESAASRPRAVRQADPESAASRPRPLQQADLESAASRPRPLRQADPECAASRPRAVQQADPENKQ